MKKLARFSFRLPSLIMCTVLVVVISVLFGYHCIHRPKLVTCIVKHVRHQVEKHVTLSEPRYGPCSVDRDFFPGSMSYLTNKICPPETRCNVSRPPVEWTDRCLRENKACCNRYGWKHRIVLHTVVAGNKEDEAIQILVDEKPAYHEHSYRRINETTCESIEPFQYCEQYGYTLHDVYIRAGSSYTIEFESLIHSNSTNLTPMKNVVLSCQQAECDIRSWQVGTVHQCTILVD